MAVEGFRRLKMDWVAVLGAVGSLATIVGGGIGVWWMRILSKRQKHEVEMAKLSREAKKEEEKNRRTQKRDTDKDFDALFEAQKVALSESREEIHELRNRLDVTDRKETVCQLRLAKVETQYEELSSRMTAAMSYIEDLETALEKAHVPVIRRVRQQGSSVHRSAPEQPPPAGDDNG